MSFFDAPWHIVLVLLVALLLFGSSRLPGAAKALGSSMNIFKRSLKEGAADDHGQPDVTTVTQAAAPAAPELTSRASAPAQQAQIDELQRQIQELRQATPAGDARPGNGASSEQAQHDKQSH
jgi:sec-independent protein translocase protein TatA